MCVGSDGLAHVYGDYPNYQEFAYFVQPDECQNVGQPVEVCQPNTPLTWNYNATAVKVCRVPGTMNGSNHFDLTAWMSGLNNNSGGIWEDWSVVNGTLVTAPGVPIDCLLSMESFDVSQIAVTPNPFQDLLTIDAEKRSVTIYEAVGKIVFENPDFTSKIINTTSFSKGL